jgi:hypothetical protein
MSAKPHAAFIVLLFTSILLFFAASMAFFPSLGHICFLSSWHSGGVTLERSVCSSHHFALLPTSFRVARPLKYFSPVFVLFDWCVSQYYQQPEDTIVLNYIWGASI